MMQRILCAEESSQKIFASVATSPTAERSTAICLRQFNFLLVLWVDRAQAAKNDVPYLLRLTFKWCIQFSSACL